MKILFSNPPWWEQSDGHLRKGIRAGSRWPFTMHAPHAPDRFRFGGYLPYPFFLGYAASYTAKALPDAQVTMRDSIARGESYIAFLAHLRVLQPDWIVIETATPSWDHDAMLLRHIYTELPKLRVILAGTIDKDRHAAIVSAHPNVWAIVQGEYDKQVASVVRDADSLPRGTTYAHDLLTVEEMNAAPTPMWDEACAMHYWDGCPVGHQPPQLQVWTSRGCPFKCCFCVWPAVMTGNDPDGTKPRAVRCYSPEYMERFLTERIEWAKARGTPYRSIYLDDDTANLQRKHTREMCAVMAKIGLPWSAMCRADTILYEDWRLMKNSGCFGVKLGFESGSQEVIDKIVNKRLDLGKAAETARYIRSIGMSVHGTFTVGLPGETKEQEAQTHAFIAALYDTGALTSHQLSGTATIEGTPLSAIAGGAHLTAYPGAKAEGFEVTGDGQRKVEGMHR